MQCEPWTNHSITEEQPARFCGTDAQMPICRNYQMGNRNLSPSNKQTAPPMRTHYTSNKKYPHCGCISHYRLRGRGLQLLPTRGPIHGIILADKEIGNMRIKAEPNGRVHIINARNTWATCLMYHMTYLLGRSKHNPLMVC
jgi:hypothetical protein